MPPVTLSPRQTDTQTSPNVGLIVGVSIAGVAVLVIIACAISFALARRRRFRQKPHRVSDISALKFEHSTSRGLPTTQHAQRGLHKGRQGSESAGLLEAARLEATLHDKQVSAPYDDPSQLHPPKLSINVADDSDRSSLDSEPPRTRLASPEERRTGSPYLLPRTPSPMLKSLPPLLIPGRPKENPTPPVEPVPESQPTHGQSTPCSTSATTESAYSQNSATTTMYHALGASSPSSPPPPVPPLPTHLRPLPAHLDSDSSLSRTDSRATIQRGDTVAVRNMLKARAQRTSMAAASNTQPSRSDTHISRIERPGSLDDRPFPTLQRIPETLRAGPPVELTSAFKKSVYSPCSSISSKNPSQRSNWDNSSTSDRTIEGRSDVVLSTNEHLYDPYAVIQPLRIASHKAASKSRT